MNASDSGQENGEITYKAEEGAEVVFKGSVPLDVSKFKMVSDKSILERIPESARDYVGQLDLKPFGITSMPEFGGACGGGGRYDKMVGKFTGNDVPACGFSIGFERIVMLLLENGYEVPNKGAKKAYLLDKKFPNEGLLKVLGLAKADREAGKQVLIVNMKKNKKFQKEQLVEEGYTDIQEFYKDNL